MSSNVFPQLFCNGVTFPELNFRITFVPKEDLNVNQKYKLLCQVKSLVEMCGLLNVSVHYYEVKKNEDGDYPEIEELTIEIQGRTNSFDHVQTVKLYNEFSLRWRNYFYTLPPSYIEFYNNDSFVKSKVPYHRLRYKNIAFGVLPHNGEFHEFAELQNEMVQEKWVDFYHDTRTVLIEYYVFEINFTYENIRNIFVNIEKFPTNIYFDLFNPPIIFRRNIRKNGKVRVRNLNLGSPDLLKIIPTMQYICQPYIVDADVLGLANILCLTFEDSGGIQEILARIHHQCSEKSVYYSCISVVPKYKPSEPDLKTANYECTYLMTAIFRRNFILISQTSNIFNSIKRLCELCEKNPESLEKALTAVLLALDSGKLLNFWNAIESQYIYYTSKKDEINSSDYIFRSNFSMIRKITLTPTRQLLWPKEVMLSNRVLRHFNAEYFVRVSFREEDMSKLNFNALYADAGVMESCIQKHMFNGILIGSRKYEFLAWSNSQIRDHAVGMYAMDEKGQTADAIKDWMGDFSRIFNVPKYMARMGQCFSQTEDTLSVPLHPSLVRIEDDIVRGYDPVNLRPYCFSDGVGRISLQLASHVHEALGHDKLCSAFQIRYAGFKGMLVVDPTLSDVYIVFRKSMKKFDCPNSTRLEIARTSAPVPLYLNRPVITILNGLGVRHRTFLQLQENMLKTLTDILYDESEAAKYLQSKTPTDLLNFQDLSICGIHLTTEPFFKSLLLALHRHHIEKIKCKANIAIDPSKGRNMFGVIDETSSLNYGEVFVQYTRDICYGETTKDTLIHRGDVLVTKNPCMHPGDVRKFKAIDVPSLHHIVDCIVFPQKGHRPHPNEMAGSDLDGDEYFVSWAPELIFYGKNKRATDFQAVHSRDGKEITVSHMIAFLQDFIRNDHVGEIANAHLAHADTHGIFSPICSTIAKKFSIAIDYAKNGESVYLKRSERPKKYPDFMEKTSRSRYRSKNSALGKMYRVCKDFESENQVTSIKYENIKVDPDLVYNGWEKYQENALNARNKYNALFGKMLRNYGIQHEAEALSGSFTNLHCRFQERNDRNEIEKIIIACIKKLYKCMYEEFMEEFSSSSNAGILENAMFQKASAWYIVTYSDPNAKFLSFPWIVSKYLVDIKARCTLAITPHFSPAILKLDKKILECESKNCLPQIEETGIWNKYYILCDLPVFKRALRTLTLWAQEQEIIETPGHTQGFLYMDVFLKLFFHVSEKVEYVTRESAHVKHIGKQYSAGQLCLEFLKFCSTFRFHNLDEMDTILPFKVYKHSKLAKRAIVSYHRFALSGKFQTLNFDKATKEELIIMRPIFINSEVFSCSPINTSSLEEAVEILIKYSKVNDLTLREVLQIKKVCVSATGTEEALKSLKSILRKEDSFLTDFFSSVIMSESKGEVIHMKPIFINSKVFSSSPISTSSLKKAFETLVKYSNVDYLFLREILEIKKVCVNASGSKEALKRLKSILRIKDRVLKDIFMSGIMPE